MFPFRPVRQFGYRRGIVLVAATVSVAMTGNPRLRAQAAPPAPGVRVMRDVRMNGPVWPADLNRDGRTDLLSTSDCGASGSCHVEVSLGRGDGTFDAPNESAFRGSVLGSGDFNDDGFRDVIAASPPASLEGRVTSSIVILPGNGTARLGSPIAVATANVSLHPDGSAPFFALSGDLDGDGKRDLVLPQGFGVIVYPRAGNFTFREPITLATASVEPPFDGIIVDLNGDGRRDIVTANAYGDAALSIFLNHGSLVFTRVNISLTRNATDVTAADVNGDGRMDLLVSAGRPNDIFGGPGDGEMIVLLGRGDGTFSSPAEYTVQPGPTQIVTGDFNRDGVVDVATGNQSAIVSDDCVVWQTWDSVSILAGLGHGAFAAPRNFSIGNQNDNSIDDDDQNTGGLGSFTRRYRKSLVSLNTNDLNNDGTTDLVASDGAVLMNVAAVANRRPAVNAGLDMFVQASEILLQPRASDPDEDVLAWEIRNDTGRVVANWPKTCVSPLHPGENKFTVTVKDARGGQATDIVVYTMISFESGTGSFVMPRDIGNVAAPGKERYDSSADTYMISGSGADIWGTADEVFRGHQSHRSASTGHRSARATGAQRAQDHRRHCRQRQIRRPRRGDPR
jgi:hypothetical protein